MALITLLLGVLLIFPGQGQGQGYSGQGCYGDDSCCDSRPDGCPEGEGDCDMDSHCAGELVCGEDNCNGSGFDSTDDCCKNATKPIVDGSDITVTISCNQMKRAHNEIIRAQVAHGCSSCSNTGEPSNCDREVLKDFLACPKEDSLCLLNSFAKRASCNVTEDKPDTICNALHQLISYVLYTRQTFCEKGGLREGCGWWTTLTCTARIVPLGLRCVARGLGGVVGCVKNLIGAGSKCVPCIYEILSDVISGIGK